MKKFYLPKLELDIMKLNEVEKGVELAIKYRLNSVIVTPELIDVVRSHRVAKKGQFKIYTTVDWPRGKQFLHDKMRGAPMSIMQTDGMEILLSYRGKADILSEIKYLSSFFKEFFVDSPLALRLVLGVYHSDRKESEPFEYMMEALKSVPRPEYVRTTTLNKIKVVDSKLDVQNDLVAHLKSICSCKIKTSGNISLATMKDVKAEKMAVSLEQLQSIIKEYEAELLDQDKEAVTS